MFKNFLKINTSTKIILGMFAASAILMSLGILMYPVQEIFDDIHDSENSSITESTENSSITESTEDSEDSED